MSANPEFQRFIGVVAVPEEAAPAPKGYLAYDGRPKAARPAWLPAATAGAVGMLVAGALGYVLYTTTRQHDTARHQPATAAYVAVVVSDGAKVQTGYFDIVDCASFSECRTAAQQMLSDMQQFQADRASLTVPSDLVSSDNSLGDALSAAIAGDQEYITGIDNGDDAKAKEGGSKLAAAMLNMSKAQAALGTQLK